MKQCLEAGCWAGSVNVRNHDLPSFTTIYQCNSPESCHGGPDNKTFNCRISKTSQGGFKFIIFFLCAHTCLPFQAKLAFQCYLEGYHATSEGVSIYVNFIFFHKNATEHVTRYENISMDIWYTGVLVYCTGALHYWCRNRIPSKNSPSYLELFLAVKFKRLTDI